MSIRSNIEEMMKKVQDDASVGVDLQAKAEDAIKSGQGSKEWEAYMSMFATSEKELARLLPDDETAGVLGGLLAVGAVMSRAAANTPSTLPRASL